MTETKVELPIDARLPEEYIHEVSLRMELYQRLGEAIQWEDVEEIWAEIQDRFGPSPEQALYLYHMTRLRIWAAQKGITLLKQDKLSLTIEKRKGKEVFLRKIMAPKYSTPLEMEQKILALLNEN